MSSRYSYEEGARLVKVFRLSDAFERQLTALLPSVTPTELADAADDFRLWDELARGYGVNPPSAETIRLVRYFLRRRAEQAAASDDPFAGLP